tara:strand:+ start:3736 stop:3960 length:225 start_codon:yes stop_codon:yes gene_type:complete
MDITSCDAPWLSKEEAMEMRPTEMWSAGVIVTQDDKAVVLAGTIEPTDGAFGNVNAIPNGVIVSIRPLDVAAPL